MLAADSAGEYVSPLWQAAKTKTPSQPGLVPDAEPPAPGALAAGRRRAVGVRAPAGRY